MRKSIICKVLLSFCFLLSSVEAQEQNQLVVPVETVLSVPVIGYTGYAVSQTREAVVGDMYMHRVYGDYYYRGNLGEYAMHTIVEKEGWTFVDPRMGKKGPQGLDGLYVKYNRLGDPEKVMVTDAKYGSSKLSMTLDGKQMSNLWVTSRLRDVSKVYQDAATDIVRGKYKRVYKHFAKSMPVANICLRDGTMVQVCGEKGNWYVYSNSKYLDSDLGAALNKHAKVFLEAAENKSYIPRVYNIYAKGNSYMMEWWKVDADGNEISGTRRSMYKNGLPSIIAKAIDNHLIDLLAEKQGLSKYQVREQIKQFSREEKLERLSHLAKNRPSSAMIGVLKSGANAILFMVPFDVTLQLLTTGKVDWEITFQNSLIGAASVSAGHLTGNLTTMVIHQLSQTAMWSKFSPAFCRFVPKYAPPAVGGLTSAAISYALCLATGSDVKSANIGLVSYLVADALSSAGLMGLAYTFGTASTGTAISALYGAAATHASLAWLGGGAVASGGFGMMGGAILVSGVAALVAVPISMGYMYWDIWYDFYRERKERIPYMLSSRKLEYQL